MFKNIDEVLSQASKRTMQRGQKYCEMGMVDSWLQVADDVVEAQVESSGDWLYDVIIETDGKGNVTDCFCDCPYDEEVLCKHIVAVLLTLKKEATPENTRPVQRILESLNETEMRDFLRLRIAKDKKLAMALRDCFVQPAEKGKALASIQRALERLCQRVECGENDWKTEQMVNDKLEDCINQARLHLNQEKCVLAAQIALEVLKAIREITDTFETDDNFFDTTTKAFDLLFDAAKFASQDERAPMLKLVNEAAQCSTMLCIWDEKTKELKEAVAGDDSPEEEGENLPCNGVQLAEGQGEPHSPEE